MILNMKQVKRKLLKDIIFCLWLGFEVIGVFLLAVIAGLWLDEGYIFGTGGEGFERFNLAIPRSVLEDACQRLLKAFGK